MKNPKLTPNILLKHFKERPIRLEMIRTGDSVSVDSRGDIHFFNCWFNAEERPKKKCGGWRKAEKYPYRVYYKAIDHNLTVQMDIEKIECPRDCEKNCRLEQWKKGKSNFLVVNA